MVSNKLLIIGSGPNARDAKIDFFKFDVICLNNSWVIPPMRSIDLWHRSTDFEVFAEFFPDDKLLKALDEKSMRWKGTNLIDDEYFFDVEDPSRDSTVFLDVMSPVMQTIDRMDRWEEIWFLGLDHDYSKSKSHFYGTHSRMNADTRKLLERNAPHVAHVAADPLRMGEDFMMRQFRQIRECCRENMVETVIVSDNKDSLLWRSLVDKG